MNVSVNTVVLRMYGHLHTYLCAYIHTRTLVPQFRIASTFVLGIIIMLRNTVFIPNYVNVSTLKSKSRSKEPSRSGGRTRSNVGSLPFRGFVPVPAACAFDGNCWPRDAVADGAPVGGQESQLLSIVVLRRYCL
jgi:hypothetical protein